MTDVDVWWCSLLMFQKWWNVFIQEFDVTERGGTRTQIIFCMSLSGFCSGIQDDANFWAGPRKTSDTYPIWGHGVTRPHEHQGRTGGWPLRTSERFLFVRTWLILREPLKYLYVWTYVWSPIGGFKAPVSGVERDVVSAVQVVVGTEALGAPPVAAAPHQLERQNN